MFTVAAWLLPLEQCPSLATAFMWLFMEGLFCISTSTKCFQMHWVFRSLHDVFHHKLSWQVACVNTAKLDRTCVDSIISCKYMIQV